MNFFSLFKATKKQIAITLERIGAHAGCGCPEHYVKEDLPKRVWTDAMVRGLADMCWTDAMVRGLADMWRATHEELRTQLQLQLARHTANEEASRVEMEMLADEIDTANVTIGSLRKAVADLSERLHMAEEARTKLDLALRRSNDDLRAALRRNIGLRAARKTSVTSKKGKSK